MKESQTRLGAVVAPIIREFSFPGEGSKPGESLRSANFELDGVCQFSTLNFYIFPSNMATMRYRPYNVERSSLLKRTGETLSPNNSLKRFDLSNNILEGGRLEKIEEYNAVTSQIGLQLPKRGNRLLTREA